MDPIVIIPVGTLLYKSKKAGRRYLDAHEPLWLAFDENTTYRYCTHAMREGEERPQWDQDVCSYNIFTTLRPLRVVNVTPDTVERVLRMFPEVIPTLNELRERASYTETDYEMLERLCQRNLDGIQYQNMNTYQGFPWHDEIGLCPDVSTSENLALLATIDRPIRQLFHDVINYVKEELSLSPEEAEVMALLYLLDEGYRVPGMAEDVLWILSIEDVENILFRLPESDLTDKLWRGLQLIT